MTRPRTGLATVALVLALAGCGNEADQLAADACDLFDQAFSGDADMEAMEAVQDEMRELAQRAEEADISDEEMQEAFRDECPDAMDTLEGFAPGQ